MASDKVTIGALVLLKASGGHYVDNIERTKLLLDSIVKFGTGKSFDNFTLLCPDDEVKAIADAFSDYRFVDVVGDSTVCHDIKRYPATGWKKQQFLKLSAAATSNQDFIMTFDPDIFCVRGFDLADFFSGQKAIMGFESKDIHPEWWIDSAKALQIDPSTLAQRVMTVTPCIYSRDVARLLKRFIETSHSDIWDDYLLNISSDTNWVEHGLYFCALIKFAVFDLFHFVTDVDIIHCEYNLWFRNNASSWEAKNLLDSSGGIFSVVASSTFLPFSEFEGAIRETLQIPFRTKPF